LFSLGDEGTWHSIFRLLTAVAVLLALAWGSVYLRRGWQSTWRNQGKVAAKQPFVPPVDPALARDPAVQAATIKVVGPLANQLQPV
jgi:hypothetical protein